MSAGRNLTPLVGWHPSAGLAAWLEAEVERRGGGRGTRSAILEEALAAYRDAIEQSRGTPDGTGHRDAAPDRLAAIGSDLRSLLDRHFSEDAAGQQPQR